MVHNSRIRSARDRNSRLKRHFRRRKSIDWSPARSIALFVHFYITDYAYTNSFFCVCVIFIPRQWAPEGTLESQLVFPPLMPFEQSGSTPVAPISWWFGTRRLPIDRSAGGDGLLHRLPRKPHLLARTKHVYYRDQPPGYRRSCGGGPRRRRASRWCVPRPRPRSAHRRIGRSP